VSTRADFEQAKRIFDQAVELPPKERAAFVDASCAADSGIRYQLERMLAQFDSDSQELTAQVEFDSDVSNEVERGWFGGTDRFKIRRRLGSGAFGTVYEAYDRERKASIALKLLERCRPDSLYRFKREFRSLVNTRHENLVHLYELISEGGRWFFTMELVDGVDFIEYVRPHNDHCDYGRLRNALRQLVFAVNSLHAAKQIHRDLKPANVLVSKSGRLVVLDFGLIKQLEDDLPLQTMTMVGTPAYMSPEQADHLPLNTASDWYSIGVMLFQALTGSLPNSSSLVQRWTSDSQLSEPRAVNPEVPADLNDLCRRLLERTPYNRPTGEQVSRAMVDVTESGADSGMERVVPSSESFFGREEELRVLDAALAETLSGKLTVVLIEGASGIGKSALAHHFLRSIKLRHADTLTLVGRCYEFESVPYKGLDALLDELSQYLQGLPQEKVEALLPRDAYLLLRLFPVLGRVRAIASSPVITAVVPDAQELRQRTFAALRELFGRIADRQPLVVWIDDLQWGDRDSSSFLAELCAPPLQPPLLLLLTYRVDEGNSRSTLGYFGRMFDGNQKIIGNWRHIVLKGLTDEESSALLRHFLESDARGAYETKIVSEAQGHPLFLQELARFVNSTSDLSAQDPRNVDLRSFLLRRIEVIPIAAREVLELISIAAQPISLSTLCIASDKSDSSDPLETIALLIRENLIRTSGDEHEKRAEPFHDQVRSVVITSISGETKKIRHGQLARALAAQPGFEPQALVMHYREAGDLVSASKSALMAANAAEHQLAFNRAAIFYEAALETASPEDLGRESLIVKFADCLSKAGRGKDAANAYLKAASFPGVDSSAMRRLAADQLMRSGYIDDAMKIFAELSRQIGVGVPRTPAAAIRGIILGRLRARLRLLGGVPRAIKGSLAGAQVARLEVMRTGAVTLEIIDPVSAAYFQVRYVSDALRSHGPAQLATALALEACLRAATGTRRPENSLRLLDRAGQIANELGDPNTIGFIYLCRAYLDYLMGWLPDGIKDASRTIEHLRQNCTGVSWELTAAHVLLIWFKCWAGYVDEVRELFPQLLREGAARGDLNVEVSIRLLTAIHYYYLSDDRPEECLAQTRRALEKWSVAGFHIQHYGALFGNVESYLYMGDYARARQYLVKAWEPMSKSFILRRQILTVKAFFLRGRVALACWLDSRGNIELRREVEHCAKRLKGIRSSWGGPMAGLLYAALAVGDHRKDEACRLLDESAEKLTKISLHAYASAATYLSGALRADAAGKAQIDSAKQFLVSQHVRKPEAFLRMLVPGKLI
jgi:serine/threonine protein kinase